jgi:hypothetical protein
MSTEPTTTDVRALATVIRDGELTLEQRGRLVDLLHSLNTAAMLAQRDHYPDNDRAGAGLPDHHLGAGLQRLRRVSRDGEGHAA